MDKREENIEEILNGGCIIPADKEIEITSEEMQEWVKGMQEQQKEYDNRHMTANVEIFRDWLDMHNSEDNGIKINDVYLPDLDLMWGNLGVEEIELLEFEYNSVAEEFYIKNTLTKIGYTIQLA